MLPLSPEGHCNAADSPTLAGRGRILKLSTMMRLAVRGRRRCEFKNVAANRVAFCSAKPAVPFARFAERIEGRLS
jgi:hypothetical protein